MRVAYKPFPTTPHPAFPKQDTVWWPVLNLVIFYRHNRSRRIEAIVDSGSQQCLFHAGIGEALGMNVDDGVEGPLGGVIGGATGKVYYHKIRLLVAGESIEIMAGFSHQLSVPGLLGQIGFFDNFIVTFDWTPHPPCLDVQRIQRN